MGKYKELVGLLEDVGVLQLEEEWAIQIQKLIEAHRKGKNESLPISLQDSVNHGAP